MYIDSLVLLILGLGIFLGIKNGMFVEFLSVFGLILNVLTTKKITPSIIELFQIKVINGNYVLTYVVIFIGVFLVIKIILSIVKRVLKKSEKGIFSRGIGGLLGGIKGFILIGILLVVFNYASDFVPSLENYSENSKSNEIFLTIIPDIEKFLPESFFEKMNKKRNEKFIDNAIIKYLEN